VRVWRAPPPPPPRCHHGEQNGDFASTYTSYSMDLAYFKLFWFENIQASWGVTLCFSRRFNLQQHLCENFNFPFFNSLISLRRANHLSRGVLPTVVRFLFVWSRNLKNEEALAYWGLLRQINKKIIVGHLYKLRIVWSYQSVTLQPRL